MLFVNVVQRRSICTSTCCRPSRVGVLKQKESVLMGRQSHCGRDGTFYRDTLKVDFALEEKFVYVSRTCLWLGQVVTVTVTAGLVFQDSRRRHQLCIGRNS